MIDPNCPFKVGDTAIFLDASGKAAGFPGRDGLPLVGERVKIISVSEGPYGTYLRWEGGENYAGGGLLWTEFAPVGDQ